MAKIKSDLFKICLFNCRERCWVKSTFRALATSIANKEGGAPLRVEIPAELTSKLSSLFSFSIFFKMPSAMGLRQQLPVQTNRTLNLCEAFIRIFVLFHAELPNNKKLKGETTTKNAFYIRANKNENLRDLIKQV